MHQAAAALAVARVVPEREAIAPGGLALLAVLHLAAAAGGAGARRSPVQARRLIGGHGARAGGRQAAGGRRRSGGAAVRGAARGADLRHADLVEVEVLAHGHDFQRARTRGERDAFLADPLERAPAAGAGDRHRAGDVDAIHLDAERRARVVVRQAQIDVIGAGGRHVHRVGEPFAGLEVIDDVAAAGAVGGGDDVHVLAGAVLPAGIAADVVVIALAFAAAVEILGFKSPRQRDRAAGVGSRCCCGKMRAEPGCAEHAQDCGADRRDREGTSRYWCPKLFGQHLRLSPVSVSK
jgi:hypothetical protein